MSSGSEQGCLSAATVLLRLLVVAVCFDASTVNASPWTLSRGEIALVTAFDYQFANQEFLERGERKNFPLRGRYSASNITLGLRAGFTDRFELGLEVPLKLVSYTSDPVILLSTPLTGMPALDFYQQNIIDFSQTRQGVGDVWLSGRYNLLRTAVAIALEGRIKLPAGYDGPEGTFGDDPATIEDFTENVVEVTSPDNISDDVALGDGQIDLNVNALFGVSFPSRTFMRLDTGYNLRVSAGDQVLASFKIGQSIGQRILLYADTRLTYTVTRGPRIGVSVAADDPNVPAADYVGLNNLRLRELRLERDALDVTVGGIVRVGERSEINLGYARTLWGRNTAAINTFYVGIGIRTDAAPDEPEPAAEPLEQDALEEEVADEEAYVDALPEEADQSGVDAPEESPPSSP